MSAKTQLRARDVADEPRFVVGMDAHAHKLAISIWDWSDKFNPCLHHEIRCLDLDAMVKTYERHVDRDSVTIIEASTNSTILKKRLDAAGFRAEIVRSDIIADKECKRKAMPGKKYCWQHPKSAKKATGTDAKKAPKAAAKPTTKNAVAKPAAK